MAFGSLWAASGGLMAASGDLQAFQAAVDLCFRYSPRGCRDFWALLGGMDFGTDFLYFLVAWNFARKCSPRSSRGFSGST